MGNYDTRGPHDPIHIPNGDGREQGVRSSG